MDRRALGVLAVFLVACTKKEPPAVRPVPAEIVDAATPRTIAPAASVALAKTADPRWQDDPPKTWTDKRVLDGLAADCEFLPPEHRRTDTDDGTPADLFRCTFGYEQSCVADPCGEPVDTCKTSCSDTCRSCGTTCSTSCTSCKAGCTDDACTRACATSCAECKQTCARTMDRCSSGACTRAAQACHKDLVRAFAANGCGAVCDRLAKCRLACSNTPSVGTECWGGCAGNRDEKLNACMTSCIGEPGCMRKCYTTSGCPSALCETLGN